MFSDKNGRQRMKRLTIIVFFMLFPLTASAQTFQAKDITAENQFTDAVKINGPGLVAISDTSSMSMTVSLQISIDGGTTWIDTGDTWTAEGVDTLADGLGKKYRLGVKTGDFTSGTATVYLGGANVR